MLYRLPHIHTRQHSRKSFIPMCSDCIWTGHVKTVCIDAITMVCVENFFSAFRSIRQKRKQVWWMTVPYAKYSCYCKLCIACALECLLRETRGYRYRDARAMVCFYTQRQMCILFDWFYSITRCFIYGYIVFKAI